MLTRPSGRLFGRQLQDRLDGGAASDINEFVACQSALFDEIHHGQQQLPAFGEKIGQLPFVGLPLLVDRMVASFHGGSSFQGFGHPDSLLRIRTNRRSTFN
ncbi:MAG TPA: hypothetical protein VKZ53_32170 [Candidatus Angelobacter sp.]|nr:hypothetical protein [Candidatus Angelobacter sp.]